MYKVQASAAVPSMSIPSPAGFFVLIRSRPKVQASRALHSFGDGVSESQGVSVRSMLFGEVEGYLIDPSR